MPAKSFSKTDTLIDTTVIVPAYNEEQGLPVVLEALERSLPASCEVVVVDDGSRDKTAQVARGYSCHLISHKLNRGKGEAMRTGLEIARGEKIIFIDADGTYPVEVIPRIAQALDTYDIVIGSRILGQQNIPLFNRLGNFLFRIVLRYLFGFKAQDPLTGLYGLHKVHLMKMQLGSSGFGIESEIAIKAASMGLKMLDIQVNYHERIGKAKLHPLRDGYRILRTIFAFILLYNPTMTFIVPGLVLLGLGLVLMVILWFGPVQLGNFALGMHTTMIAAMLALVGFQGIVFGAATKLYALAHKFTRSDLVTVMILRPSVRKALVGVGLVSIVTGLVWGFQLVRDWASDGFGKFTHTQEAEFTSFLIVFGFQMLLSVGFIWIFAEDVLRAKYLFDRTDSR